MREQSPLCWGLHSTEVTFAQITQLPRVQCSWCSRCCWDLSKALLRVSGQRLNNVDGIHLHCKLVLKKSSWFETLNVSPAWAKQWACSVFIYSTGKKKNAKCRSQETNKEILHLLMRDEVSAIDIKRLKYSLFEQQQVMGLELRLCLQFALMLIIAASPGLLTFNPN